MSLQGNAHPLAYKDGDPCPWHYGLFVDNIHTNVENI